MKTQNDLVCHDIESAMKMIAQAQDRCQKNTDAWKILDAVWEELDSLKETLNET
jgi:hypothetical protein